jgi:enoyl-CoA hydratase
MRRAMEIMLTGGEMLGPEAAQIGWANRSFPAVALDDEVLDVASQIAAVATDLAQINKRIDKPKLWEFALRSGPVRNSRHSLVTRHQSRSLNKIHWL